MREPLLALVGSCQHVCPSQALASVPEQLLSRNLSATARSISLCIPLAFSFTVELCSASMLFNILFEDSKSETGSLVEPLPFPLSSNAFTSQNALPHH